MNLASDRVQFEDRVLRALIGCAFDPLRHYDHDTAFLRSQWSPEEFQSWQLDILHTSHSFDIRSVTQELKRWRLRALRHPKGQTPSPETSTLEFHTARLLTTCVRVITDHLGLDIVSNDMTVHVLYWAMLRRIL